MAKRKIDQISTQDSKDDWLSEAYDLAKKLARDCQEIIGGAFHNESKNIEFKGSVDLVTATDKAVEKLIFSKIKEKYPDHKLLGEESYSGGKYNLTDDPTWIVDPIDGTTNFVHKVPFCAVSIALSVGKQVQIGVVFNPITNDFWCARKGHGAFWNGNPMHTSSISKVQQAVVATNAGYDRTEEGANFMTGMIKNLLLSNVRALKMSGSSALEISHVACGRFDVFYEFGIHPWDIAAACVILTESGGVVVDPIGGKPLDLENRRVLACASEQLKDEIVAILGKSKVPEKWTKQQQ